MYLSSGSVAVAPAVAEQLPPGPLRIGRIWSRSRGANAILSEDGLLDRYMTDLTAPYGMEFRADQYLAGNRNSYADLGAALLDEHGVFEEPLDLIVVAHAVPDPAPLRSVGSYLTHLCPGEALAFTISDQGIAAPYTALQIAGELAATHGFRRALLVICDQTTFPYEITVPLEALAAQDVAVGVLLEADGPHRVTGLRQRRGVAPESVRDTVAEEIAALGGPDREATIIPGTGLDGVYDWSCVADRVSPGPFRMPCTGSWGELGRWLTTPASQGGRVIVIDYDRSLGYLCLFAVDVAGGAGT